MNPANTKLYSPLSAKEKAKRLWERFLLPFRRYKATYEGARPIGRLALACSSIIPGTGDLLLGEWETGLTCLSVAVAYVYYMAVIGWKHLFGIVRLDYINLLAVSLFATVIFLVIWYLSFRSVERKTSLISSGQKLHGSYVVNFVRQVANRIRSFFAGYRKIFDASKSGRRYRLVASFFLLGIDQILDKQYIKGFLFLICELGYGAYMALVGASQLAGLVTLKAANQVSTATLVYGILAILATVFFAIIYLANLASVRQNNELRLAGKQVPGYKEEIGEANNRKFYLISLAIPVAGAIAFTIIPLIFMILIAFTDYGTSGTIPIMNLRWVSWTGLSSFAQLFGLSENLKTLVNVIEWTMVWAVLATFSCYFGGFFLAMLLAKKSVKPKILYRSLFVVAMAVPQFVTLRVMNTMFNEYGPINTLLLNWGVISGRVAFWDNVTWAKVLIVGVNMWVGIPYYMLLISGLLLNIPKDYYEAAAIEGASRGQMFRKITFPHIFFMTTPLLITSFVSNINNFNVIWLLTGGGPLGQGTGGVAGGTDILITWLYKLTMQNNPEYNLGAAIGIIMFIISAVISLIIFRSSSAYKREEEFRQ